MNQNPISSTQASGSPTPPEDYVDCIVQYIKCGIKLIVFLVLAGLAVGAGYVALRVIWYGVKLVLQAIGA